MARPLRIEYLGADYQVMKRGLSRRHSFLQDKNRERFLDLLSDISRLWKIQIYAYGLMDNPDHLLLQTVGRMKAGVEVERRVGQRACRIEEEFQKSQERI